MWWMHSGEARLGCAPRPWQLLRKWSWAQTAWSCSWIEEFLLATKATQVDGDTVARGSRGGDDHPGCSLRSPPRWPPALGARLRPLRRSSESPYYQSITSHLYRFYRFFEILVILVILEFYSMTTFYMTTVFFSDSTSRGITTSEV